MTLTFLLAFLFYNDGIQTVIGVASTYGAKQLGLGQSVLIATILLIQFVAFGGALVFGRLAAGYGSYRSILWRHLRLGGGRGAGGLLPDGNVPLFLVVGVAIAVVLGRHPGAVAVVLQPAHPARPGRGVLRALQRLRAGDVVVRHVLFGVVFQLTGSYRPALVALVVFFVLGAGATAAAGPASGASGRRATPRPPWSSRPSRHARRRTRPGRLGTVAGALLRVPLRTGPLLEWPTVAIRESRGRLGR